MTYFAKLGLVFALFLALTGAGLAHRAPVVAMDDGLAAYLATGGSLADICGGAEDGAVPGCAACHLVGGAVLPPVAATARPMPLVQAGPVIAPQLAQSLGLIADPSRPVRAPPSV